MGNFDELLYRLIQNNRRVIIPDIGAFITNSSDENTVFSPLLKHNDGFLENEIQKEGIANPAFFLKEFAENIISVLERGQRYHIAGLGYFFNDGNIRFVFEDIEKDIVAEYSDEVYFTEKKGKTNKLRIFLSLIFLCLIVIVVLLFILFNIYILEDGSNMFIFQKEKPDNQFVIVDKSDDCDETNDLQQFSQTKSYYIIVACFEEKDNADNFVLQCKKNGYNKAEILYITSVLYLVSIGAFSLQDEAQNKKKEYDKRFGENSMILKTK